VEKLSVAAFLAAKHPSLFMKPFQNLADLHAPTMPTVGIGVNAERQNSLAPRHPPEMCNKILIAASSEVIGSPSHFA
jgi:hypothetical protein